MTSRPWSVRLAFGVAAAALALLVAVGVAEVVLWAWPPTPRRVVVRAAEVGGFVGAPDRPLWFTDRRLVGGDVLGRLRRPACPDDPGTYRVLVLGDSILHGLATPLPDTSAVRLGQGLRRHAPGVPVCVRNLAEPGFSLGQILAAGLAEVAERPPDLVVLELWAIPRAPYRVGDTVYQMAGDPGAPDWALALGVPRAVQEAVLSRSALAELLFFVAPDPPEAAVLGPTYRRELDQLVERVRSHGGEVVVVLPADLTTPWDAQPEGVVMGHEMYEAWAAERGVPAHRFSSLLATHDPRSIAIDPVHLDDRGQILLGAALAEVGVPAFDRWRAAR